MSAQTSNPSVMQIHKTGLPRSGKNIWKLKNFQVGEKAGNFADGQGNLGRTRKVREKSGNLKVNSYGRQSLENLFKRVKSKPIYLLIGGYSNRKGFSPLGSKFFPLRVTPKLEMI